MDMWDIGDLRTEDASFYDADPVEMMSNTSFHLPSHKENHVKKTES